MSHLTIDVTTMGFRIAVNKVGDIKGTKVNIVPFSKQFQNKQYDRVDGVWYVVNEFFYYDSENEIVYFPRFSLDEFKTFLNMNGVTYSIKEIPSIEGKDETFFMLPFVEYKNDRQKNAIAYLTNENTGPVRGLALQTGYGKTIAAIWAIQKLGKRCIITMTSRLEQWVKELIKYTTLEENDIYVIQGLGSLTKLFKQIDDGIKPKIILASTATMRLYIEYRPSYQHLPHPSEMCEKLGIGIIGTDEYHEHFHTNFLIGLMFNPKVFIPITATFSASDPFVKNIFDKFIPNDLQFVGGEYDRFVNVTAYTYRGGGHLIKPYQYTSRQGYSQQMFEKFLMSKKGKFVLDPVVQDAIIPIIRDHYINLAEDGEKLLVLCSSTKLCDHLEAVFKRDFTHKTVSVFYSGRPSTILEKFDIIISTPGSAGTGTDIKNLRTCFVFENTNSEIRNLQFIGRLRPYPAVKNTPEFVYLSFSCIPQHQKYHNARSMLFGQRALSMKHRSIS